MRLHRINNLKQFSKPPKPGTTHFLQCNKKIFIKWQSRYNKQIIHRDGILDNKLWIRSRIKVLIVLKEDYDCRKIFNNNLAKAFRYWALGRAAKPTLRRLYLISYGVFYPQKRTPQANKQWRLAEKCFMSSALINLKKVKGRSVSNFGNIDSFAKRNADLLKSQISLINPDIIVCGGTFGHMKHLFSQIQPFGYGVKNLFIGDNIPIIRAHHPAYPYIKYMNYHSEIQNAARTNQAHPRRTRKNNLNTCSQC